MLDGTVYAFATKVSANVCSFCYLASALPSATLLPLARDLGKFGIRVVAFAPSVFTTPMAAIIDPKKAEISRKQISLGRLGSPDEFADLCVTSCKNSYLNGTVIRLDGGQTLGHL